MDQNKKNNKPGKGGGNARGIISLVCWALLLTILVSYGANYMSSAGHQSSTVVLYYSDFLDMAESGQLEEVVFDASERIMHLSPAEGYVYTDPAGTAYTKGKDKEWTYTDSLGQQRTTALDPIVVETPTTSWWPSCGSGTSASRRITSLLSAPCWPCW